MIVELCDGGHGSAVLWIHQRQILHVQDFHNIGPLLLVHGHPGVPALHDLRHGAEVQHGRGGQHETILQRGQDILHGFGPERTLAELHFDKLVVRVVHTSPDHLHGLLADAAGAHVPPQDQVQQESEGAGEGTRQNQTDLGQPYQTRGHLEPVAGAYYVRYQLGQKEHEEPAGENSGQDGPVQAVQENPENRVAQGTDEQERAHQNVPSPPDGLQALGALLLIFRAAAVEDVQLQRVQPKQTQIQASDRAANQHQQHNDQNKTP